MRKEYGKVLRGQFDKKLSEDVPDFKHVNVKSKYIFPGERAYAWEVSDKICCWLILVPDQDADLRFTVEIGWSRLGRFPELTMRPSATLEGKEDKIYTEKECILRLSQLWSNLDPWWGDTKVSIDLTPIPKEKASNAVKELVRESIDKIKEQGLPFLKKAIDTSLS